MTCPRDADRLCDPKKSGFARLIRSALNLRVLQHDDGSRPGMHDLDIVLADRAYAAVEVTAAADQDSIELWNLMNGGGRWCEEGLAGGWMVELQPNVDDSQA